MNNQLNPEAKIFNPQIKPFSCTKTLTLENLNIQNNNNSLNCIAKNVSGISIGEQCLNTKIEGFDYCFLHKGMVDSGKYFLLQNKRKSKYYSNSDTCSTEPPLSSPSNYFDTDSTYSSCYSSVSDNIISIYSDDKDSASTTSLSD